MSHLDIEAVDISKNGDAQENFAFWKADGDEPVKIKMLETGERNCGYYHINEELLKDMYENVFTHEYNYHFGSCGSTLSCFGGSAGSGKSMIVDTKRGDRRILNKALRFYDSADFFVAYNPEEDMFMHTMGPVRKDVLVEDMAGENIDGWYVYRASSSGEIDWSFAVIDGTELQDDNPNWRNRKTLKNLMQSVSRSLRIPKEEPKIFDIDLYYKPIKAVDHIHIDLDVKRT